MHLYFVTRGIKRDVDNLITQLQGKWFTYKCRVPGDTQLTDHILEMSVRPVQLWELGFPEEHLDLVCNSIFGKTDKGKPQHKWQYKFVALIRRMLKLDKIPDYKMETEFPIGSCKDNIEIVGIGTKKDYYVNLSGAHVTKRTEGCYEAI